MSDQRFNQTNQQEQLRNLLQAQHALQQQQRIHQFWLQQTQEQDDATDLKTHNLPLARIKKIMKFDEDVRMISAEVLDLFARACECFIQELTLRAWMCTEDNKRKTLQRSDIATAIQRTDIYDFLIDIVPREDAKPNKGRQDDTPSPVIFPEQAYYLLAQQATQQQLQGDVAAQLVAAAQRIPFTDPAAFMAYQQQQAIQQLQYRVALQQQQQLMQMQFQQIQSQPVREQPTALQNQDQPPRRPSSPLQSPSSQTPSPVQSPSQMPVLSPQVQSLPQLQSQPQTQSQAQLLQEQLKLQAQLQAEIQTQRQAKLQLQTQLQAHLQPQTLLQTWPPLQGSLQAQSLLTQVPQAQSQVHVQAQEQTQEQEEQTREYYLSHQQESDPAHTKATDTTAKTPKRPLV